MGAVAGALAVVSGCLATGAQPIPKRWRTMTLDVIKLLPKKTLLLLHPMPDIMSKLNNRNMLVTGKLRWVGLLPGVSLLVVEEAA